LTFGHSGAQGWAPECTEVENYKWSVSQPCIESRSHCPYFGTLDKMG